MFWVGVVVLALFVAVYCRVLLLEWRTQWGLYRAPKENEKS